MRMSEDVRVKVGEAQQSYITETGVLWVSYFQISTQDLC